MGWVLSLLFEYGLLTWFHNFFPTGGNWWQNCPPKFNIIVWLKCFSSINQFLFEKSKTFMNLSMYSNIYDWMFLTIYEKSSQPELILQSVFLKPLEMSLIHYVISRILIKVTGRYFSVTLLVYCFDFIRRSFWKYSEHSFFT